MYIEWSELARQSSGGDAKAIEILNQGVQNQAEPRLLLVAQLAKLAVVTIDGSCSQTERVDVVGGSACAKGSKESASHDAALVPEQSTTTSPSGTSGSDDDVTMPLGKVEEPSAPEEAPVGTRILRTRGDETTLPVPPNASKTSLSNVTSYNTIDSSRSSRGATSKGVSNSTSRPLTKPSGTALGPLGLLAAGKCQRVVKGASLSMFDSRKDAEKEEDATTDTVKSIQAAGSADLRTSTQKRPLETENEDEFDGDISMMTTTVKLESTKEQRQSKKLDLSKYVDDTLLKFDPRSRRDRPASTVNGQAPTSNHDKSFSHPAVLQSTSQYSSSFVVKHDAPTQSGAGAAFASNSASSNKATKNSAAASVTLLNTTLSSVESDAETARLDEMALAEPTIPSNPVQQQQQMEFVVERQVDHHKNAEHHGESAQSKRKRVSFARPGGMENDRETKIYEECSNKRQCGGPPAGAPTKSSTARPQTGDPSFEGEMLPAGSFAANLRQLTMNKRSYLRLGVLGKGGSSWVHRVINDAGQIYAYKKVDVRGNDESDAVFDSYVNEIELLRRLKGSPYIIELIDAEINRGDMFIAMVMEVGEVDLSKVLAQKQRKDDSGSGAIELNPFFVRLAWQEMLEAVDHIHENRIVHGDLKPANFVFVKGHLKLIDFGIAKAFSNDTTNIYRESQIGTVNYMAPEAIAPMADSSERTDAEDRTMKMRLGRASDIWSLGCILYQMIFGRPPFAALNTIQKLHAIPNPKYEIAYPAHGEADAIDSIQACLVRDARRRATIKGENGLLSRSFLSLKSNTGANVTVVPCDQVKAKASFTLETITTVIDAVFDEIGDAPNKYGAEESDALCIKVWSLLNEISNNSRSSVIATTSNHSSFSYASSDGSSSSSGKGAQTIIPGMLMNKSKQSPSKQIKPFQQSGKGKRSPLKALSPTLQQQLLNQSSNLQPMTQSSRASRWMKPEENSPQKHDMKSVVERRITAMRTFLDVDQ